MLIRVAKFIFIFSLITMMFYCAKQGAPGGGPVDKEPPGVIKTIPKTDSIGIPLNLKAVSYTHLTLPTNREV